MKKLLFFYAKILLPIVVLFWLNKLDFIHKNVFVFLLFFYAFIFRTYIDGKKLSRKKLIHKKEIWKIVIPGVRIKYFKELYLKK